ncbi:hypothetical protein SEA_HANNACONDA_113 [Mycobacterium phage Hannaconda]|nr:hypothetical protein SEA_HANNACONDA_113 [Mycobacterium phage Hannaconda]
MYGNYENFGLTEVVEASTYREYYDWRCLGVWWHEETQSYRVSTDGGCSCSSPWEYHRALDDFGRPLTFAEARKAIQDEHFDANCFDEKLRAIDKLTEFEQAR